MTLKICWVGCETCEGYEDATINNQSCYDCKNGYAFNKTYKNSDNHDLGNCFTDSTEIPGYYILGRNFEKCDESCLRCEIQSTNCSECANGYYRKDKTSREECFKKENNLYLNETDNILYYCHENCESCSEGGDNFNNKCDKCIENYYFYEDKETHIKNCVENSPLENYYLDKTDNTFYECYKRCALCQYPGNDIYHNCIKCHNSNDLTSVDLEDYYKIENNEIQCYNREEIKNFGKYKNYYFDDENRIKKNVMRVVQHVKKEVIMKIQNVIHVLMDMFLLNYQRI